LLYELVSQAMLQFDDMFLTAIQYAEKTVALAPNWSEGYVTLGRAQREFGEPEAALQSFKTALSLDTSNTEIISEISELELICSRIKASIQQQRSEICKCAGDNSNENENEAALCILHLKSRVKVIDMK
jgi:hypothetical protein